MEEDGSMEEHDSRRPVKKAMALDAGAEPKTLAL
jgi:hypothetical protein